MRRREFLICFLTGRGEGEQDQPAVVPARPGRHRFGRDLATSIRLGGRGRPSGKTAPWAMPVQHVVSGCSRRSRSYATE